MDVSWAGDPRSPVVPPVTPDDTAATRTRSFRHTLLTTDGVRIAAAHDAGPAGGTLCLVVAHGFTGALERPAVRRAVRELTAGAGVVTFTFRGHGTSGGRSTVGDREVHDVDAAVGWARRLGYAAVVTVGFSMGGSVVLRHAAGRDGTAEAVDAVASVSAPARWYYRGTAPMRRLHWAVTRPAGRLVARAVLGVRVVPDAWDPVPLAPVECVPFVPPVPLLVVHGDRDAYFPLDHPRSLVGAAGPGGAEFWLEHGFGHAENAAAPDLLRRVGAWAGARAGNGGREGRGNAAADPGRDAAADPGRGAAGGAGTGAGRGAGPGALPSGAPEASSWTARGA